jgi:hypothetical protein
MDALIEVSQAENDLRDRWGELTPEQAKERMLLLTGDSYRADEAFAKRSIEYEFEKQARTGK